MRLVLASILVCATGSVALARPVTIGISAGTVQSENDYDDEAEGLLQAWGRVGLSGRLSAQLNLEKESMSNSDVRVRSGTAALVVELGPIGGPKGRVFPLVFGGVGIDRADDGYGGGQDGNHIEGGLGVELRLDGGFVIGVDARIGDRSADNQEDVILDGGTGVAAYYVPVMPTGEYRSLRLGVGSGLGFRGRWARGRSGPGWGGRPGRREPRDRSSQSPTADPYRRR